MIKPIKGEVYDIQWIDITEEATGDPRKITPCILTNTWRFHSWRRIKLDNGKTKLCGVFTSSKVKDGEDFYHAIILPKGCITEIKRVSYDKEGMA